MSTLYRFNRYVQEDGALTETHTNFILAQTPVADLADALKQLAAAFLRTPQGEAFNRSIAGDFNFGDVISEVPRSFWQEQHLSLLPADRRRWPKLARSIPDQQIAVVTVNNDTVIRVPVVTA